MTTVTERLPRGGPAPAERDRPPIDGIGHPVPIDDPDVGALHHDGTVLSESDDHWRLVPSAGVRILTNRQDAARDDDLQLQTTSLLEQLVTLGPWVDPDLGDLLLREL